MVFARQFTTLAKYSGQAWSLLALIAVEPPKKMLMYNFSLDMHFGLGFFGTPY